MLYVEDAWVCSVKADSVLWRLIVDEYPEELLEAAESDRDIWFLFT